MKEGTLAPVVFVFGGVVVVWVFEAFNGGLCGRGKGWRGGFGGQAQRGNVGATRRMQRPGLVVLAEHKVPPPPLLSRLAGGRR